MNPSELSAISVIIPAYNEAQSIEEIIRTLQNVLSGLGRKNEIVVVDDGSLDGTGLLAEKMQVRVLYHPTNYGYGRAILNGIDASLHETIVIIDADASYPCESLSDLLALYDKGFDMVVGARQGPHYYSSLTKKGLRLIFKMLAEFSTGRQIPDINSGMRVFRKSPVVALRDSVSTGFSFTTTVTLLFFLNGLFVGYHPIAYRKRAGSSKVHLTRDGLRSLQIIVTTIAQFNPLKLYLLLLETDVIGTIALALFAVGNTSSASLFITAMGWQTLHLIAALAILSVSVGVRARLAPNLLSKK
jgi:glycosyltransferase involved in cell wall biosynthesis